MRTSQSRPPLVFRGVVRMAELAAGRGRHGEWRRELDGLWTLAERGEVQGDARLEMAALCRGALVEAGWASARREWAHETVRRPWFPLALATLALALLGWASQGFAATGEIIAAFCRVSYELPPLPRVPWNDRAQETVVGYTIPLFFAVFASVFLVAARRPRLARGGLRYWLLFAAKLTLVPALVTLGWVEATEAARARLTWEPLRVLGAGLLFWCLYVAAFTRAVLWCITDQQIRCPACGKRLAMPVSLGTYASVFEPPVTEFICDEGHGRLSVSATWDGEMEEWREMDESWRDLFPASPR